MFANHETPIHSAETVDSREAVVQPGRTAHNRTYSEGEKHANCGHVLGWAAKLFNLIAWKRLFRRQAHTRRREASTYPYFLTSTNLQQKETHVTNQNDDVMVLISSHFF